MEDDPRWGEEDPDRHRGGGGDSRRDPDNDPPDRVARQWFWSSTERQYCYYSAKDGSLVFQNGERIKRPSPTTLSSLRPSGTPGVSVSSRQPSSASRAPPYVAPSTGLLHDQFVSEAPADDVVNTISSSGLQRRVDTHSGVRVTVQTGDLGEIVSHSDLLQRGLRPLCVILTSEVIDRPVFQRYYQRNSSFFQPGRVFSVLWATLSSDSPLDDGTETKRQVDRRNPSHKYKIFVVVRSEDDYCVVVQITTYDGQGVAKAGVSKFQHSIIHSSRESPNPEHGEIPISHVYGTEGQPMLSPPIRVRMNRPQDALDYMSRVNFAAVYIVRHTVNALSIGEVHPRSMLDLQHHFHTTWSVGNEVTAPGMRSRFTVPVSPTTPRQDRNIRRDSGGPAQLQAIPQGPAKEVVEYLMASGRSQSQALEVFDAALRQIMATGWSREQALGRIYYAFRAKMQAENQRETNAVGEGEDDDDDDDDDHDEDEEDDDDDDYRTQ